MKFFTNLTLGKKITLITTVGLLLGVGVFSSVAMRAVNRSTETMLQDRLTTAQVVSDYMDEALGRALLELKNTAGVIDSDGTKDELERQVGTLENTYSRLSIYIDSTYFLNHNRELAWSKPGITEAGEIDLFSYPTIDLAMKSGEPTISGLVSAPMINTPVVFLASPIQTGYQGSTGVLVVAIDVAQSSIGGFIRPIRLGETGYAEIIDQNGIVVTRTEPGPELAPFEESEHSGRFAELIAAGKPTRGVCHTCHEPEQTVQREDVLAFMPLSQANWGVVIRQSEEEALAPIYELRQNLILFGAGLAIIAVMLVVITTQDIGGRIRLLTAASKKIAEGDLISPVSSLGKDEVGTLAHTLDDMRVKLNTSYGALEQRTQELASLLSVSEILTSTFDLPRLLNAVLTKAVEIIPNADGGVLFLEDTQRGNMLLQCATGIDKDSLSQLVTDLDNRYSTIPIPEIADKAEIEILKENITVFLQSEALPSRARSTICADVFHMNRHIGILVMVSLKDSEAFSDSDRRLVQAIADYIAIAIERSQLAKEAEEARALHEADRLRSQFISSVSHELRTPLTLIKGYSTSLLRQDTSWDENTRQEFLQIIDEKSDELRDLIDKLLQSAKLEAGALRLDKEPLLLPQLARKVIEDITRRTRKNDFVLEFMPSFPVIEADFRCMEQVLRNLVENAIKYSPAGGKVYITGKVKDGNIVASVRDEGIGIPPEHQDRVFERFYRISNPSTSNAPGSGLGLSIVRGHIEAHGGSVWLESGVKKGSIFYFSLPLEQADNSQ